MVAIRLRPATRADIPLLERWDEAPHVAASDPDDDWGWGDMLEGAAPGFDTYVAEADGAPFGVVQVTDPARDASRYWGEMPPGVRALDVWIGPADLLGRGLGTLMTRAALTLCFADPSVRAVFIDPLATNERAIRFYRRLGFAFVENRWFDDSHCAVHRISRETFENETRP
jgi:aminoglycoside 6'-N-acetyltransferase